MELSKKLLFLILKYVNIHIGAAKTYSQPKVFVSFIFNIGIFTVKVFGKEISGIYFYISAWKPLAYFRRINGVTSFKLDPNSQIPNKHYNLAYI